MKFNTFLRIRLKNAKYLRWNCFFFSLQYVLLYCVELFPPCHCLLISLQNNLQFLFFYLGENHSFETCLHNEEKMFSTLGQFHQCSTCSFYVCMLRAQLFCAYVLGLYFTGARLLAQKSHLERWWNWVLDFLIFRGLLSATGIIKNVELSTKSLKMMLTGLMQNLNGRKFLNLLTLCKKTQHF